MAVVDAVIKLLKALVLFLLGCALTASIFVLLIGTAVQNNALNYEFWKATFEEKNMYAGLREAMLESFVSPMAEGEEIPPQFKTAFAEKINASISLSWVRGQTDKMVKNLLMYLNSETSQLSLSISLAEIKPAIADAMTTVLIEQYTEQFENATETGPGGCASTEECVSYCTINVNDTECISFMQDMESLTALLSELGCEDFGQCMEKCREPTPDISDKCSMLGPAFAKLPGSKQMLEEILTNATTQTKAQIEQNMPDKIDFASMIAEGEALHFFETAKNGVQILKLITALSFIAIPVILILIFVLTRSVRAVVGELGTSMLFGGAISYAWIVGMPWMMTKFAGEGVPPLALEIFRAIFDSTATTAIIVAVVGVVLIVASFFFLKKEEKKEEAEKAKK